MSLHRAALVALLSAALAGCGASAAPRAKSGKSSAGSEAAALQVRLGRGYLEQGKYETAHEKLERALQLDPGSVDAHTLMAILYERIDRPKLSEKHYRRAAELDPDDGSTNNNLGAYLCRYERYDEADAYFIRALEDPFYATPQAAWSNAGVCATRAGNSPKAETYFRRALEIDPKDASALFELASISFRKNEYLRARAFMQRLESTGHSDAAALELAVRIEERLGDAAAAAKYRERLKTEFPDRAPETPIEGSNSP